MNAIRARRVVSVVLTRLDGLGGTRRPIFPLGVFQQEHAARKYWKACLPHWSFRSTQISKKALHSCAAVRSKMEGLTEKSASLPSNYNVTEVNAGSHDVRSILEESRTRMEKDSSGIWDLRSEWEKEWERVQSTMDDITARIDENGHYNIADAYCDDVMKFNANVFILHTSITTRMGMDLEKLICSVKSEELTHRENVWRDGPHYVLLAANLKFMNFTPDEWNVSISRMDQSPKASSLTSEQIKLLKRFEDWLSCVLAS